jgi:hypothetical protein
VHPFDDRVILHDLEPRVINSLELQINSPGSRRNDTPLRKRLRDLGKDHQLK